MKSRTHEQRGAALASCLDKDFAYPVVSCNKEGELIGGDVAVQDQSTKIVDFYFKNLVGYVTLASNTTIFSYTVTLTAGHGVTTSNYLTFLEGDNISQFKVLNVATNTITLDSPLDFAYTTSAEIRKTTIGMNVDGSTTPVIFDIAPDQNSKLHINCIVLSLEDNTAMDSGMFGGITALTKGIVIRRLNDINHNITNIKTNGEFRVRGFNVLYDDKAPSGVYGLCANKCFNGQTNNGVTIFLNGETQDKLQIIIQDNLTGLTKFTATAQGHYVLD